MNATSDGALGSSGMLRRQYSTCRARMFLLTLALAAVRGQLAAAQTTEAIIAAYERSQAEIRSILVEFESRSAAIAAQREFYRRIGAVDTPVSNVTEVVVGEMLYQRSVTRRRNVQGAVVPYLIATLGKRPKLGKGRAALDELTDKQFDELLEQVRRLEPETSEAERLYNGVVLREMRPAAQDAEPAHYIVREPALAEARCFGVFYLDYAYRGINDPCLREGVHATQFIVPALLRSSPPPKRSVASADDGSECVVFEFEAFTKIWLDPKLNFAVRKSEISKEGKLINVVRCDDFAEVIPAIWIPRKIHVEHFAAEASAAIAAPLFATDMVCKRVEVNLDSHADYFRAEPEAGSLVSDLRIPAKGKPNGKARPVVSYIQPADAQDVDRAVNEALERSARGEALPPGRLTRSARQRLWLVALGVLLIVGIGASVVLARRHRRSLSREP